MCASLKVKLILVAFYLLFLFLLTRLLELTSWYQGGALCLVSNLVLDPVSLSVQKLKKLLDQRGISYDTVLEKHELRTLVEESGNVTEADLIGAQDDDQEKRGIRTTHFSCGPHFYEEVEDSKDSIWLVQVIPSGSNKPMLDNDTWKRVVSRVAKFGALTGIFECKLDEKLCRKKGWHSHQLVLALPRGNKAKEDVIMTTLVLPMKLQVIFSWIHSHLSLRVNQITSNEQLTDWLTYTSTSKKSEIRVVFLTTLLNPPLFLSALAIRFNGRVKFGMYSVAKSQKGTYFHPKLNKSVTLPSYIVVTPEKIMYYGNRKGENLNFKSMELYLKSLRPEMNDIFLLSLFVVNLMCGFQWFLVSGKLWKHAIRCFLNVCKCNCILFLTWLLILGMCQFQFMDTIVEVSLKCVRVINSMYLSSLFRCDWINNHFSTNFHIFAFIVFGIISCAVWKKLGLEQQVDDASIFYNWWSVPWDMYIMTYFFRPMATLTRPMAPHDLDIEEGMELLIERLAVPNLWLQPVISSDYIKDLPTWYYSAKGTNVCLKSEAQSESSSEEDYYTSEYYCSCNGPSRNPNPENVEGETACDVTTENENRNSCVQSSHKKCIIHNNDGANSSSEHSTHSSQPLSDLNSSEKTTAPPGMLESTECSICLDHYIQGSILCGLPCGHNYHAQCIFLWLYRDNHCCPVCRWPSYKQKPGRDAAHLHLN